MIFNFRKRDTRKETNSTDEKESSESRLFKLLFSLCYYTGIAGKKISVGINKIRISTVRAIHHEEAASMIFVLFVCCLSIPLLLATASSTQPDVEVEQPQEEVEPAQLSSIGWDLTEFYPQVTTLIMPIPLAAEPDPIPDEPIDLGPEDDPLIMLGNNEIIEGLEDVETVTSDDPYRDLYGLSQSTPSSNMVYYDVPLPYAAQEFLWEQCQARGIPMEIALGLIRAESTYRPNLISKTNDYGLMQINRGNHSSVRRALGLPSDASFLDPYVNIMGGCYILGNAYAQHGDWHLALISYNYGYVPSGKTSTDYSRRVMGYANELAGKEIYPVGPGPQFDNTPYYNYHETPIIPEYTYEDPIIYAIPDELLEPTDSVTENEETIENEIIDTESDEILSETENVPTDDNPEDPIIIENDTVDPTPVDVDETPMGVETTPIEG